MNPAWRSISGAACLGGRQGGNLKFVAADVHAAPTARAFLARVEKVHDTLFALANAIDLRLAQKIRRAIKDQLPHVRWPLEIKPLHPNNSPLLLTQHRGRRILQQTSIHLLDEFIRWSRTAFYTQNSFPQPFPERD